MLKENDQKFIAGPSPSIADCWVVPQLVNFTKGHIDHVATDVLEGHPLIGEYIARFYALPEVKAYHDTA